MKGRNSKRAVTLSILILIQLVICSLATVASAFFDGYARIILVKLIYTASFVFPYVLWKRAIKPVGVTLSKRSLCEYKIPAFFIAFAAIVACLQINIVALEIFSVSRETSASMPEGFGGFLFSLFVYALLPAATEELFYRGVVARVAGMGRRAAILSGIVFGLCHFDPSQLIYAVGSGVVLGLLYLYTDDIRMPIGLHLTVNTTVLLLSYLSRLVTVGVYVAVECFVWLAVLSIGVYYCYIVLRDHQRAIRQKNEEVMKMKGDISISETISPAMLIVWIAIAVSTVLRLL